jgi:hypothetical protein
MMMWLLVGGIVEWGQHQQTAQSRSDDVGQIELCEEVADETNPTANKLALSLRP